MTPGLQLVVLAKAPAPGRVKTRLSPPYQPQEAARLAAASLADVLDAVRAAPAARRVLVLDGDPGLVDARGLDLLPQGTGTLDVRLAAAFAAVSGAPAFLVGMDTPQLTPRHLADAGDALSGRDACLGLAVDGGWWGLGLRRPDPGLLLGVPCSLPTTGRAQLHRLVTAGLSIARLPLLRDVDVADDAVQVARFAPTTRFARLHAELSRSSGSRGAVPEAAAL
ncbi:TIGR04282 family arsenosugar biosynthesis glycosyltransferase [Geodermatophilus chilensis]|uniref:TIGR04282 family arsenosugar biosynthesis glycosyltransferase n=1 Tax=Geodermatophilus chilensis TaxID=2035835 RepID=UPI0018E4404D|nr:DUF2064 domain-containing protein [Geodermatophilus chilensis]